MERHPYSPAFDVATVTMRLHDQERLTDWEANRRCDSLVGLPPQRRMLLLRNSRQFLHLEVCLALIRRCESLRHHDPIEMCELARLAIDGVEELRRSLLPATIIADLQTEAWATYANALRIANANRAAEAALRAAWRYRARGTGDLLLEARLLRFQGALSSDQRRFDHAIEAYTEAGRRYRQLGERHLTGQVMVSLGRVRGLVGHQEEAIHLLQAALDLLEPERDSQVILVTFFLLADYLGQVGRPELGLEVLESSRSISGITPGDLLGLRLHWIEARLLIDCGRLEPAIAALRRVLAEFVEREMVYDAAHASLDLALACAKSGRHREVAELADQVLPFLSSSELHREANATLLLFVQAVKSGTASADTIQRLLTRFQAAES